MKDSLMCQACNLGIILQSCSALLLRSFQLTLLELTDALDTNVLAELGKDFSLSLVDDTPEGINALFESVVCRLSLTQLRLLLPQFTIDVLDLLFDAIQAKLACTLQEA